MVEKLEEIKRLGAYALNITFGEDVGCDDMDVSTDKRRIICIYTPVGCLGERRILWKGNYADFVAFDFSSSPKVISNPPKSEEYKDDGFYTWGTQRSIEDVVAAAS